MADHDHSYKLLFAHPQMVRDLLEGFVGGRWLERLDFSTLERVSDSRVSDDLRARADDIVWRVRCGKRDVYLLLEFQSATEPFMAVRVLTYVALLYQDLIRARKVSGRGLPVVLPIVLYNGTSRWSAAKELASLLHAPPPELRRYRPAARYLLIDEGAYNDASLDRERNLVAILFQLENCRRGDRIVELMKRLEERLQGAQDSLRRAFAIWLDKSKFASLSGCEHRSIVNNLWEKRSMLSEQIPIWIEEFRQEGRQQGRQEGRQQGEAKLLALVLERRFGALTDSLRTLLLNAKPEQIERWAEQFVDARSLKEVFGVESFPVQ